MPQSASELPDGAHVNIVLQPAVMPQELFGRRPAMVIQDEKYAKK